MVRKTTEIGLQDHPPARSVTSECFPGCNAATRGRTIRTMTIATLQLSSYVSANIKEKQMEDQELQLIINAKQSNEHITPAQEAAQSLELRWLLQIRDHFPVSNGVLYRFFLDKVQPSGIRYRLMVPQCLRDKVLEGVHESAIGGHLGDEKTLQKLKEQFYWLGHCQTV